MDSLDAVLTLVALLMLDGLVLAGLAIWLDPRSGELAWRQGRAERPPVRRAA